MSWRKKVTAKTLEELQGKAELHFAPGTAYKVYSIRDASASGTRVHYRAEAMPAGASGSHRTPIPRREPSVAHAPAPNAPELDMEHPVPVWKPVDIPASVLRSAPGQARSIHLLTDRDDMIPGSADIMTVDSDIMDLLEHADPPVESTGDGGQVVYVGLLDDPVFAAEGDGHLSWSSAGDIVGGDEGASAICYGLGDGSNVSSISEGLRAYDGIKMILVVDSSRKVADTLTWVTEVIKVVLPSAVVPIFTAYTASPETINEVRRLIS